VHCIYSAENKTCLVVDLISTDEEKIKYVGSHLKEGIEHIIFEDSVLHQFPGEIFTAIKSITSVTAVDSTILELSTSVFIRAANLKTLNLANNSIAVLHNNVFFGAYRLDDLNLAHNQIADVHHSAFYKLELLTTLNLNDNRISELEKDTFNDLSSLQNLYLSHNLLQHLDYKLFQFNPQLRVLHLEYNRLLNIDDDIFVNQLHLNTLQLNNNHLKYLVPSKAKVVNIDVNNVTELFINEHVEDLLASNSQIRKITVDNNAVIKKLILGYNNISDVRPVAGLQLLEYLDLSHNNISTVNLTMFVSLHKLDLFLDGNHLKEIAFGKIKYTLPEQKASSWLDHRWNCSYLAWMIKKLDSNGVKLHFASEIYPKRGDSVEGIACRGNKNSNQATEVNNQFADFLEALLEYLRKFSYAFRVAVKG
jgi:Leucine-rich repeat (LRR) protein